MTRLCFLNAKSQRLEYDNGADARLVVELEDFPHVAFWSLPPAPYLCIEPWTGHGDPEDFHGDLYEKPSMRRSGARRKRAPWRDIPPWKRTDASNRNSSCDLSPPPRLHSRLEGRLNDHRRQCDRRHRQARRSSNCGRPPKPTGCRILGKAEFMNPGGSVKDRAALSIVKDAIAQRRR